MCRAGSEGDAQPDSLRSLLQRSTIYARAKSMGCRRCRLWLGRRRPVAAGRIQAGCLVGSQTTEAVRDVVRSGGIPADGKGNVVDGTPATLLDGGTDGRCARRRVRDGEPVATVATSNQ